MRGDSGRSLLWENQPAPSEPWRRPHCERSAVDDCTRPDGPRREDGSYAASRTQRGNRKEIMRLLMCYIARELYPIILESLMPEPALEDVA